MNKGRRRERQEQARERQAAADKRTPKEQLARLIARGHGHCREAERLRAEIGA